MANGYTELEAADQLNKIAQMMLEIDQMLQRGYRYWPKDIREMVEKADPNCDMDPSFWGKKLQEISATVIEEELAKEDAAFSARHKSSDDIAEPDSPGL